MQISFCYIPWSASILTCTGCPLKLLMCAFSTTLSDTQSLSNIDLWSQFYIHFVIFKGSLRVMVIIIIPSPLNNYCISDPQMNLKMLFWLLLIFKVKHTNKTVTSVDVPYNNSSIFEPYSHEWTTFTDFTHGYLLWIWPHNISLVFKI